jgi:DnaJ-class molecular chaperone
VGNLRKSSSDRIRIRALQEVDDRETLLPCDACKGQGYSIHEKIDGCYVMKKCKWCQGLGAVVPEMLVAFRRWKNIMKCNKCKEILRDI